MTLDEFREATKDMPGDLNILRAYNLGYEAIFSVNIIDVRDNYSDDPNRLFKAIV